MPVIKTQAVNAVGIDELTKAAQAHQEYLTKSGKRVAKQEEFIRNEVLDILTEGLGRSVHIQFQTASGQELLKQVINREMDPYQAAAVLSGGSGA